MAIVDIMKKVSISLTEEEWNKIKEVYSIIDKVGEELKRNDLYLDSDDIRWEDFKNDILVGETISDIHSNLEFLLTEKKR